MPPNLPIPVRVESRRRTVRPDGRHAEQHLLRDCLAISSVTAKVPARVRLEQAIGQELAQKLLASLTMGGRR